MAKRGTTKKVTASKTSKRGSAVPPPQRGIALPGDVPQKTPGGSGTALPGDVPEKTPGGSGTALPGDVPEKTPGGSGIALPGDVPEKTPGGSGTALPGDVPEKTPGGSPVPRLVIRQGANLPHWRKDGATYSVTFRLADSLPQEVLVGWKAERAHTVRRAEQMGRPLTEFELRRLDELHSERVEKWLDQGHGSCILRDPRIARLVRDAMLHFDGERYDLLAWCVMPNHVHAVLHTFPGRDLSMVMLSWKGFTGKKAREILGTVGEGEFWQKEPYDHLVRDEQDLAHCIRYVLANPTAAGLTDWPWVGVGRGTALPGGVTGEDTGRKPGATAKANQ